MLNKTRCAHVLCNKYPMQTYEPFLVHVHLGLCFITTCSNMIFSVLTNHQMLQWKGNVCIHDSHELTENSWNFKMLSFSIWNVRADKIGQHHATKGSDIAYCILKQMLWWKKLSFTYWLLVCLRLDLFFFSEKEKRLCVLLL